MTCTRADWASLAEVKQQCLSGTSMRDESRCLVHNMSNDDYAVWAYGSYSYNVRRKGKTYKRTFYSWRVIFVRTWTQEHEHKIASSGVMRLSERHGGSMNKEWCLKRIIGVITKFEKRARKKITEALEFDMTMSALAGDTAGS